MLLDEFERSDSEQMQELNNLSLAGYKANGRATRLEKVKDTFVPRDYCVYGPKCFAGIDGLNPVLSSRCITICTERVGPKSPKPKRLIDAYDWQTIRDDLHCMAVEHGSEWRRIGAAGNFGQSLTGRNFEIWRPVMTMAEFFDTNGVSGLVDLIAGYAAGSVAESASAKIPDIDEIILQVLTDARTRRDEFIPAEPTADEILQTARSRSFDNFKNVTPIKVGCRLRIYKLHSTQAKGGRRREYRPSISQLQAIEDKYGISLGVF